MYREEGCRWEGWRGRGREKGGGRGELRRGEGQGDVAVSGGGTVWCAMCHPSGLWFRPMEALRFSGEALGLLSRLKGHWVP